jgi:Amt family ammonium transporter
MGLPGYTLSFGPDVGGFIGDLSWIGLRSVSTAPHPAYGPTIPHLVFAVFQCMFAVITPALITGAFAERMRFGPFLLFSMLWTVLVYNPVCHWVWASGGWLRGLGVIDFAGGLVVHLACGSAALAAVTVIKPRKGYGSENFIPHNLPMTLIGTGLLWFGWFGFNGAARSPRTALPEAPSWRLTWAAWRAWSPGWRWNGSTGASPPPWEPPPGRWRAWPP